MLSTLLLILFITITNSIKKDGIRLIKQGRGQGAFIIICSKMLFWFSVIELFYIWFRPSLLYVLPVVLVLFIYNIFLDRKILTQGILSKKTEEYSPTYLR